MKNYKVVSEEGVDVDGVHFEKGEVLELDSEANETLVLLENEMLVEDVETVQADDVAADEATGSDDTADEDDVADDVHEVEGSVLYFQGQKVTSEVVDKEVEGVMYKTFTIADGSSYTLGLAEFEEKVSSSEQA